MRGSAGVRILGVVLVASVACGRNAPLDTGTGTAGTRPAVGAAGQGGSMSGIAGATPTGGAGAGPGGTSGAAGIAMCGAPTLASGLCVSGAFKHADGVCQCQQGFPCACPGAGCVDPMLDPDNCGACGVRCGPTSTCNAGVCGAAPVMVSPPIADCSAMTLVATDGDVYFADAVHGAINKVGSAKPLAVNEVGATFLQANGPNLYWYATGSQKIRRVTTGGGPVNDVFTVPTSADGGAPLDVAGFLVSPDGTTIYISLGTQVLQAPVGGGTTTVVADEVRYGRPAALALNGTTSIVYPVTLNGDVDAALLGAMPATCGSEDGNGNVLMTTCARLARGQGSLFPNFIAAIAGRAYWIDGENLKSETIGSVGTSFDSVAFAQTSNITAAAAALDTIYFADADSSDPTHGFIEKTSLAPNSTPTVLARAQSSPVAMAVNATKVTWATSDCAIWSLDR